jgi:hypothetical protein
LPLWPAACGKRARLQVTAPLRDPEDLWDAVVVVEENVGRKALVIGTGYIVSGIRFKSSNFTQQL